MPDSTSLDRTSEASKQIDQFFADNPSVMNRTIVNGYSLIDSQYQSNMATFFVTLKDFKERYASTATAMKERSSCNLSMSGQVLSGQVLLFLSLLQLFQV